MVVWPTIIKRCWALGAVDIADESAGPSSLHTQWAHAHMPTSSFTPLHWSTQGFCATCYCQHKRVLLQHLMLTIIWLCKRKAVVYCEKSCHSESETRIQRVERDWRVLSDSIVLILLWVGQRWQRNPGWKTLHFLGRHFRLKRKRQILHVPGDLHHQAFVIPLDVD